MSNILRINHVDSSTLTIIGSTAGVGKSVLLRYITKEFIEQKNKVLFVSDDSHSALSVRFNRHIKYPKIGGSLTLINTKDLLSKLPKLEFNVLVLDENYHLDKDKIIALHNYCFNNSVKLILSTQLIRNVNNIDVLSKISPNELKARATYIFVITKKTEFSFKEKFKYFFLFWLNKPNITIQCVKNRY